MILGIGTDLLDIRRAKEMLERQSLAAVARLMRPAEQAFYKPHTSDDPSALARGFAKTWAYKEAMIKALGCRPAPFSWHDFEVAHTPQGKPFGKLHNAALKEALIASSARTLASRRSLQPQDINVFLTLSDDSPYIVATCVIELL